MSDLNVSTLKLQSCLFNVRDAISATPVNLPQIKTTLVELLVYLASPEGRTSANCTTADTFFSLHDDYGFSWFHLPEEFRLILEDIGGHLHDTVDHPDIATNFESTPEQLLERVHCLKVWDDVQPEA